MKKIKIILISCTILLAIGTAYATRPCQACTYAEQYYAAGSGYISAGEFGWDYYCLQYGGTCTFYKPYPIAYPNYYLPCRSGQFTRVP